MIHFFHDSHSKHYFFWYFIKNFLHRWFYAIKLFINSLHNNLLFHLPYLIAIYNLTHENMKWKNVLFFLVANTKKYLSLETLHFTTIFHNVLCGLFHRKKNIISRLNGNEIDLLDIRLHNQLIKYLKICNFSTKFFPHFQQFIFRDLCIIELRKRN